MPQIADLTYSADEVSGVLRCDPETFRRKRRDLEAAGFPRRLPHCALWSKPAVDHWIRTAGGTYGPLMPGAASGPQPQITIVTDALEAKYAS